MIIQCPYCPKEIDTSDLNTVCEKCKEEILKNVRDKWQEVDDDGWPMEQSA